MKGSRARIATAAVAIAALAGWSPPAGAQGLDTALDRCAVQEDAARCVEGAVAAQSLLARSGLLFGLGSEIAGSPTTLGRRIGNAPRIAGSLRVGGLQARVPDLLDRGRTPAEENDFFLPALHGSAAIGLFEGFRLAPTVGGFLSFDLVGSGAVVFFPPGEGFEGSVAGFSLGARIGIIRESFTLPGITLSVARRYGGNIRYGDGETGGPQEVEIDPAVTSLRVVVGKDLFSVGVLGGLGWDDYSSDVTIGLRDAQGSPSGSLATPVDAGRLLAFGGASITFLVLQISGEFGWAQGLSTVPGYMGAPFDPTRGSMFGSFAARLTL